MGQLLVNISSTISYPYPLSHSGDEACRWMGMIFPLCVYFMHFVERTHKNH